MSRQICLNLGKNWESLLNEYRGPCSEASQYLLSQFPGADSSCQKAFNQVVANIIAANHCSRPVQSAGFTGNDQEDYKTDQEIKVEKCGEYHQCISDSFMDSAKKIMENFLNNFYPGQKYNDVCSHIYKDIKEKDYCSHLYSEGYENDKQECLGILEKFVLEKLKLNIEVN
jgi:hypothetical protein